MLRFHAGLKVFIAIESVDLPESFSGLWGVAREKLNEDPGSGAMFIFTNRRRNRIKILYAVRSGLWILIKRLKKGTFHWPVSAEGNEMKIRLTPCALPRRYSCCSTALTFEKGVGGLGMNIRYLDSIDYK